MRIIGPACVSRPNWNACAFSRVLHCAFNIFFVCILRRFARLENQNKKKGVDTNKLIAFGVFLLQALNLFSLMSFTCSTHIHVYIERQLHSLVAQTVHVEDERVPLIKRCNCHRLRLAFLSAQRARERENSREKWQMQASQGERERRRQKERNHKYRKREREKKKERDQRDREKIWKS